MTFQVNATGSSEFLHLGDTIPKTKIRLSDFDPATQELIVTDIHVEPARASRTSEAGRFTAHLLNMNEALRATSTHPANFHVRP